MKHRRSFVVVTLVAGTVMLGGGEILHAVETGPEIGQPMYAAAMSEPHGHDARGYLGIEMRDVSEDQVGVLKLKDARGAEITTLDHDGPACKAGMRQHDVIVQMNGQAIENEDQLRRLLRDMPIGRTVSFVVSRDGLSQTMTMTTADRRTIGLQAWEQHYTVPAPGTVHGNSFMDSKATTTTAVQKEHKDLLGTETIVLSSSFTGAKLEVMGPQLAEFFGATDGGGLLVRSVEGNSPAEEAGLKAGDVVVKINSIAVANGTDWTKTVHDNKGKPVPVVVLRDRHEQILTLTPDGKKRSSLWFGFGLDDFFQQTSQQTRQLLARL
ncbi:MAG TPA: PDZ domain-containing protein [Edaphobacter sp.]|jgi:S1-C subfamily serine protease|nr:PDZ domain-containing protein [Edaphobacter sp.]